MKVKIKKELIKHLRNEKSWTQEKFAEICGIHSRTIQRVENEGTVSANTLNKIAHALEIEPHCLEVTSDKIDFGPLYIEIRLLALAITRRIIPLDKRNIPNSLVAVLTLVSFSAIYTLLHSLILIVNQPEASFDSPTSLAAYVLIILFSLIYAGIIYPFFQLKSWARSSMLVICWLFFIINGGLLIAEVILNNSEKNIEFDFSNLLENSLNILIILWIYRILTRQDIRRLFSDKENFLSSANE